MSKPLDQFDWLANYYDVLSGLVFGNALKDSEQHFLHLLPKGCTILIVGGGTGLILRQIFQHNPTCHVWFIEASRKMLSRAIKNVPRKYADQVQFVYGTEESIAGDVKFDVLLTSFYLDLYPDKELPEVCAALRQRLCERGLWLVNDFSDGGKWWQRLMLWVMYRFFVAACRISARTLPDWEKFLKRAGFFRVDEAFFYGRFVKSAVFVKASLNEDSAL
jgi:ubiquinone/menaquinone biosynthesis C-methylase UbiE